MSVFNVFIRSLCPPQSHRRRFMVCALALLVVWISQSNPSAHAGQSHSGGAASPTSTMGAASPASPASEKGTAQVTTKAPVQTEAPMAPMAPAAPAAPAAVKRFEVNVTGSGPDVVLIPGLGSSGEVWAATVAKLEPMARLHTLTLAGFAGVPAAGEVAAGAGMDTGAGAGSGTASNQEVIRPAVAALHDYIATHVMANKRPAPVVVGHSIGGLMALELARTRPHSVSKIVLVDTLPYVGLMFSPAATVPAFGPQASFMRDQMLAMPQATFAAQQAVTAARLVTAPADQTLVAGWTVASDRRVFAQAFLDAMRIDVRPDLAALKTPATLFYAFDAAAGQNDAQTDALYRGAYQSLAQLKFRRFDNSRHFIMLDQPVAFVQALADELALR